MKSRNLLGLSARKGRRWPAEWVNKRHGADVWRDGYAAAMANLFAGPLIQPGKRLGSFLNNY